MLHLFTQYPRKGIYALYIENFFNFYADYEQDYYAFNPVLNLIIADYGKGKSEPFSAFSWILKMK